MATVRIASAAVEDLDRLILTLSLPLETRARVVASLHVLKRFPEIGPELSGRWSGLRFVLGPWRWLLLVYELDVENDRVIIVTIQDARSSDAARGSS